MGIILASGSPRRRELLEMLGLKFEIRPARGGEHPPEGAGPEETVLALASAKAEEIAEHSAENDVIIAADTIVWLDGKLLGKPHDEADAARMLRSLSGREHEVWFEDARSIRAKLELARSRGLYGVGYWNLMRPFPQNWALLNSLYEIPPGDETLS